MVTPDGVVKVRDFGLAAVAQANTARSSSDPRDSRLAYIPQTFLDVPIQAPFHQIANHAGYSRGVFQDQWVRAKWGAGARATRHVPAEFLRRGAAANACG
jgi:hypothetical protein